MAARWLFAGSCEWQAARMPLKLPDSDNDYLPVTVPRSDKPVVPVSPERVERLRQHLLETLRDLRKARRIDRLVSSVSPEPDGFRSVVARTACSLCRGSCCRHGGDEAFLDDRTLARFRVAEPEITDQAIARLYLDRVPEVVQGESCIFHGKRGCTLDRSMRADVCNRFFCGGLSAYIRSNAAPEPTVVLAGEGEKMRISSVLVPPSGDGARTTARAVGRYRAAARE